MEKLEKIPAGWMIVNEEPIFNLVDAEGKIKSSIVYSLENDSFGRKSLNLVSVASKDKRKGYYGLLFAGLESFAKTEGVAYFSGRINPENTFSLKVHEHYGFVQSRYLVDSSGKERRIEIRKDISI